VIFHSYVNVDQSEKNDLALSENGVCTYVQPLKEALTQFETDDAPLDFQGPHGMRHHSKIQQGVGSCIF